MIHDKFTSIGARRPQLQVHGGRTLDAHPAEGLGWKLRTAWRDLGMFVSALLSGYLFKVTAKLQYGRWTAAAMAGPFLLVSEEAVA